MKILIAGDYCPIGRTDKYLQEEKYDELFNGFEKVIQKCDFSIINFECPITKSEIKIDKTGPCIKTENLNSLKALQFAGFNLLTLANNHIQDYSGQGVVDTIEVAKKNGFDVVGAGKNSVEASKPFVTEIQGIKIGFINIAENEFCAATDTMPGANTFDFIENTRVIKELKSKVNKIILIYHGGREHYQLPTPEQRKRFRYFIDSGVDAIVAHHTHCVSGFEYHNKKPIIYSLGNFIFDYKKKYQKGIWTEGMSVILSLNNKDDNFTIELIPHLQGRENNSAFVLLENKEKEDFLEKVNNLSDKIVNDKVFFEEWKKYIKTQERFYLPSLYIKNFLLRALFMKGILPVYLLKSKHNILALNLTRCEAHSEILKKILEK
ncbi:CapA family protein [Flavobacterium solisilvae]|uniref:CapA family protein n=1 Tax=Flavobacterium solisilvae TaxID=1852019 RepID=A0ABX1QU07_9FLAO|nr:CapA family protein [Flavobacterium solisilvae]NMH25346.1 CapA family protein [Flavobacterium solisilvae]